MGGQSDAPKGPDLRAGVPFAELPDGGIVAGQVDGEAVILVRRGDTVHAVGATCTHYSGPLAEGIVEGETVRCPWHHACFSLRTGEAVRAPALNPIAAYDVERRGDRVVVTGKRAGPPDGASPSTAGALRANGAPAPRGGGARRTIERVVIVGTGAAGHAAAEMLRREGFAGDVTLLGVEDDTPYDRPNLSKDYLAGNAPEDWIPLRPRDFYDAHRITLQLGRRAVKVDAGRRVLQLADGDELSWDALVLATGADPVQLKLALSGGREIRYLRSLRDSRALIAAAADAKRALVLGASFIGLEVAASLRARGLEVHVAAPEARPLERVLGPELGDMVRALHEEHGVVFHLGHTASAADATHATLDDGSRIEADLLVAGIGVRPNVSLAESAGVAVDNGVLVNERLESSVPGIWAAGDIARWPDPHTGERIRVEHWVVAQRQGQTVGRNIAALARGDAPERFDAVPFFWSQHYDVAINYTGHAAKWDRLTIEGDPARRDCAVHYVRDGRTLAIATVGRDRENLGAEASMERMTMTAGVPHEAREGAWAR